MEVGREGGRGVGGGEGGREVGGGVGGREVGGGVGRRGGGGGEGVKGGRGGTWRWRGRDRLEVGGCTSLITGVRLARHYLDSLRRDHFVCVRVLELHVL